MRKRIIGPIAVLGAFTSALLFAAAGPASAHVAGNAGPYHFLIGWGQEPAYAGQQNGVQLILSYRSTGKPVTNLANTITVQVIYGTQKITLSFEPTFDPDTGLGTPGDYRAWFFPTAPGNYTFHLMGKIGSTKVNQSFTSSATTFNTVDDPGKLEFPVKAPNTAQLNQRLNAEIPRLATASAVQTTKSDASNAKTLAIVGIGVGALGLILAGVALVRRRS